MVMFGFPFETITTAANRAAVIDRVFDFFGPTVPPPNADFNSDGTVDAADYTVWRDSKDSTVTPGEQGDADFDGQVDDDDYSIWKLQFGTTPGAARATGAGDGAVDNGAATAVDRSASETSLQKSLVAGSLGSSPKSAEVLRSTSFALNRGFRGGVWGRRFDAGCDRTHVRAAAERLSKWVSGEKWGSATSN